MLALEGDSLRCNDRLVASSSVSGFEERYDPWRGQASLWVRGADHVEPIGANYGVLRRALRAEFPDRPFTSDWSSSFPSMPSGLPAPGVRIALVGVASVCAFALGVSPLPAVAVLPVAVAAGWGIAGRFGRVHVDAVGIAAGAPWAGRVAWHEVQSVHTEVLGRHVRVSVRGPRGLAEGTVPSVLLPAFRAKVWRHGGVRLNDALDPVDRRYQRLAPLLTGAAGASLGLGALWALSQPSVFAAWGQALMGSLALGLLAVAAETRSSGWHTGAVLALTMLYAVGLLAVTVWG